MSIQIVSQLTVNYILQHVLTIVSSHVPEVLMQSDFSIITCIQQWSVLVIYISLSLQFIPLKTPWIQPQGCCACACIHDVCRYISTYRCYVPDAVCCNATLAQPDRLFLLCGFFSPPPHKRTSGLATRDYCNASGVICSSHLINTPFSAICTNQTSPKLENHSAIGGTPDPFSEKSGSATRDESEVRLELSAPLKQALINSNTCCVLDIHSLCPSLSSFQQNHNKFARVLLFNNVFNTIKLKPTIKNFQYK